MSGDLRGGKKEEKGSGKLTKAEAEGVVTVILEELGHNSQDDIEED